MFYQEIDYSELSNHHLGALKFGEILLVRNCEPIYAFRKLIFAELQKSFLFQEIELFYTNPSYQGHQCSPEAIEMLAREIRKHQQEKTLLKLLYPFYEKLGCKTTDLTDCGLARLVVDARTINLIKNRKKLDRFYFESAPDDSDVEIFMPRKANIHRDFNRPHQCFSFNTWFGLHDLASDEILQIFPQHYRNSYVLDTDNTKRELLELSSPLDYSLPFGSCIVFHGEHLHTSPRKSHVPQGYRRHTYDVRVITDAYDDNSHYRRGSLQLGLFWHGGEGWRRLQDFQPTSEQDFDAYLDYITSLPYTDLYFLHLLDKACSFVPRPLEPILRAVDLLCKKSTNASMLQRAWMILRNAKLDDLALQVTNCATLLPSRLSLVDFCPVEYKNSRTYATLSEIIDTMLMANLSFPQSLDDVKLMTQGYQGFRIFKTLNRVYAIPQGEGEFSMERIERNNYSNFVLYSSVEEAQIKIDKIIKIELVAENYQRFNILKVGDRFYGVPQGEGEFSLEKIEQEGYSIFFVGSSME
ncbi:MULTISPECIES: hypothetical protein, partial [Spirulina sp. CCY15215]|uniref:hypothetical protein n=1 Tax=Spirulina sp. CCY15215 TaxID=2767591 RepID=UPI00194EC004